MESLRRAGNIADVVGGSLVLADIRTIQGRLRDAQRIYEQGLQLALEHGTPVLRGTADMHVGLGELARERNDLQAAMQHLRRSEAQGEHTGFPQHPYRWRVAMALVREAQGDLDGALDLLDEAERLYVSDFHPNVRPIAAWKARAWLAQGRLDAAIGWARDHDLSATDTISYLREFEHITLARILLARHATEDASGLLERLRRAADTGGRMGSVIEILILQTLTYRTQDHLPEALTALERALTLAEPEGYVRIFVGEGPPMARLLAEASAQGITPGYTGRLLAACRTNDPQGIGPFAPLVSNPGADLLSPRELEVLSLIIQGLSNKEIGERLFLALDTVKGHNRRIFSKLQVESRTAAIARARELGLTER
jgi:LuxR family maltose regulon positive regulatory protein